MLEVRTCLVILLIVWLGTTAISVAQDPRRPIGAKGSPVSGMDEVYLDHLQGLELGNAFEFGEAVMVKSSSRVLAQLSSARIKEAQEELTALGYRPGPVDGKMGRRTRGAIIQFQKDAGLALTGELDGPTMKQLAVSWSSQAKAERSQLEQEPAGVPPPPPSTSGLPKTIVNHIGMEFVLIPAGTFTMGSPDSDPNAYDDEKPAHQVTISQPFYMGKYEVTQAQWKAVMGRENNPSYFKGESLPVDHVSWGDVQAFIQKLDQQENRASGVFCRLPTEAEWEYAARAGTTTLYSFGNDAAKLADYAWYAKNANHTTYPVGQKKPNAWGLYDMHGNVLEWCQDWYGPYSAGAVTDPRGPAEGTYRVIRGGSWDRAARLARSAHRFWNHPSYRVDGLGFRCLSAGVSQ